MGKFCRKFKFRQTCPTPMYPQTDEEQNIPSAYKVVLRLRGNRIPAQKLSCFVLYLKIINTFLKNNRAYMHTCILLQIVQGSQK